MVLGYSVQHRPIIAVGLGDPDSPRRSLVVGCIHGSEPADIATAAALAREPPGGMFYPGPRPLSEPESRLAAHLIVRIRPVLAIWCHQALNLAGDWQGPSAAERRCASLPEMRRLRRPRTAWRDSAPSAACIRACERRMSARSPGLIRP